jgi:NADPH2:quinone reductase
LEYPVIPLGKNGSTNDSQSGPVPPLDILRLGSKNVKVTRPVVFNYLVTEEERRTYMTELFAMIADGKVEVKVHKVYDFKDVAQAHTDLESRKTTGKLVLKV